MKKIFYFIASAIVALGAVACQNEVDENITPGTQNDVVSFTVSFDDNTRIALGGVENGEASFVFEANETLYLNYDEKTFSFTNTAENRNTFTGEGEGLSEIVKNHLVTISNKEDLMSPSEVHTTFGEAAYFKFQNKIDGDVTLSLSNYVIRCATGADEVTLYCDHYKAAYMDVAPESLVLPANGEYWINLENAYTSEIKVSYEINGKTVKSTTLNAMVNDAYGYKIFNLGTLRAKSEWAIIGSFAASNWTDIAMYEDGNYAVAYNVTLEEANNVKFRKYSWDHDKQRTCVTAFNLNNITYFKNDGSDSPECGLTGTYDIYIPKANAGYAIVVEAGQPLPDTLDDTTISLIGTAVGGWETTNDVVLTWNKETGLFSKENVKVSADEIKLRANKGWDHSWGSGGEWTATQEIWYNGGNSTIAAGTYNISTDLKSVTVSAQ